MVFEERRRTRSQEVRDAWRARATERIREHTLLHNAICSCGHPVVGWSDYAIHLAEELYPE